MAGPTPLQALQQQGGHLNIQDVYGLHAGALRCAAMPNTRPHLDSARSVGPRRRSPRLCKALVAFFDRSSLFSRQQP